MLGENKPNKLLLSVFIIFFITSSLFSEEIDLLPPVIGEGVEWNEELYNILVKSLENDGYTIKTGASKTLFLSIKSRNEKYMVYINGLRSDIELLDASPSNLSEFIGDFDFTDVMIPKMGDLIAGGIIFYLDGKGGGLVAAPHDLDSEVNWGGNGKKIGWTSNAVGTGAANTVRIVKKLGSGTYAAKLCDDLVLNGYDDWFLPSLDELDLMYENLHRKGLGGFVSSYYWSSSEVSSFYAWYQDFGDGSQKGFGYGKFNSRYVRAVRAF